MRTTLEAGGCQLGSVLCQDLVLHWRRDFIDTVMQMLTHALSNAVDHGYVLPLRDGTPVNTVASFEVRSRIENGKAVLTVADSGAGINIKAIRELAIKKGRQDLIGGNVLEVLFVDGVSTARTASMTSGRRIGLSAIRAMARDVGGDAEMTIPEHGGTCLVITLPLDIAAEGSLLPNIVPLARIS